MFDRIDAAYYRLRAAEMREKARFVPNMDTAIRHSRIADQYEARARALLEKNASPGEGEP